MDRRMPRRRHSRREFLGIAARGGAAAAAVACGGLRLSSAARAPNIVLVFTDDQGYGDAGCCGSGKIATPNIDRLAAGGMRWTSFYAAGCVCVPSRTGLMSGQ